MKNPETKKVSFIQNQKEFFDFMWKNYRYLVFVGILFTAAIFLALFGLPFDAFFITQIAVYTWIIGAERKLKKEKIKALTQFFILYEVCKVIGVSDIIDVEKLRNNPCTGDLDTILKDCLVKAKK